MLDTMKPKHHKSKMGRPPKPPGQKQAARLMVNLTPGEASELLADAKAANLSVSAFLALCWRTYREGKP